MTLRRPDEDLPLEEVVGLYAAGWFPMDDDERQDEPLPWYSPEERGVFDLDRDALQRTRRAVRRSLARPEAERWSIVFDVAFAETLAWCARPRTAGEGVWLTPRMVRLYARLAEVGLCHTIELHDPEDGLVAGCVAVTIGKAAFLESMFHRVPHAGNVMLFRTLDLLVRSGALLCDIQMTTDHTERLGARSISRWQYLARLQEAIGLPG
ncbi:leucyl/phenylalanyl-tRNA--protein transferase [Paraconexibacter sp.]|uniref:leucyl/phenylalanyl-tRNA--protein transferase n=1 Tax=Paraconexibacter sp. TaxID=2949640 RepID=UPI003561F150